MQMEIRYNKFKIKDFQSRKKAKKGKKKNKNEMNKVMESGINKR